MLLISCETLKSYYHEECFNTSLLSDAALKLCSQDAICALAGGKYIGLCVHSVISSIFAFAPSHNLHMGMTENKKKQK